MTATFKLVSTAKTMDFLPPTPTFLVLFYFIGFFSSSGFISGFALRILLSVKSRVSASKLKYEVSQWQFVCIT